MTIVFEFFSNMWSSIIGLLNLYTFNIGGSTFSLFEILLGFFLVSMAISIFWKGAKG